MLNLTQLLSFEIKRPNLPPPLLYRCGGLHYGQDGPPVVVWNVTKSCNLNCLFCYYDAVKNLKPDGLNYALALRIVRQLKQAQIKYVLLSGGEPLLYPQILTLIEKLIFASIRVGLSTNGTLITQDTASLLKKSGIDYVGISLDGLKETHNRLRNSPTAFQRALRGLRYAKQAGLKTGIRLTLNSYNFNQIKDIFSLAENLQVQRLCFYHLVYSGRAKSRDYDLVKSERRQAINLIIKLTADWIKRKISTEVLSVDNFSDAIVLLDYVRKKKPQNYPSLLELLRKQGGCPAGKRILSIDHLGFIHPCQFWAECRLVDLKKEKLLDFLNNGNPFKEWRSKLKGRCSLCDFKETCGGCRVRAFQAYGNYWQEDPSCCLED